MKKLLLLFALLCAPLVLEAQNASPLGGVGSLQFFDNNGNLLTAGVVYIYQAGTTNQATVYTDSTGTNQQPNPVTFGSGARSSIWLANGTFVKIVLCTQNDGAFCAASDILFSADQVPIGSTGGGGGGGPNFTGVFISQTASPATSGALRLASGDSICWRNAAGSTNLCFRKDSNDLLSWDGGLFKLPEVGVPSAVTGFDILWADNTNHRFLMKNNGGTAQFIPGVGSAGVTGHFAAFASNGIDLVDSGVTTPGFKLEGVNITPVTVASTNSLTPLQGVTISANDIGASQTFEIDIQGVGSCVATPTLTIGLYLDNVLIAQTTPLTGSRNWNTTLWTMHAFFTGLTTGATGTVSPALQTFFDTGTGTTTPSATPNSAVTIDTTSSHVLQLKAQWGVSSASNTVTSNTMTVYRVN